MISAAFIVGPSRSGTSVLAEALDKHKKVTATEEFHFYNLLQPAVAGSERESQILYAQLMAIQYEKRFFEIKNGEEVDPRRVAGEDALSGTGAVLPSFFGKLARDENAQLVVEQTPMNLYYIDEILQDFPQAAFVLMKRDPRAILASQSSRWMVGSHGRRHHPQRDLRRYRSAGHPFIQLLLLRKTMQVAREVENAPYVHVVIYEDLVREPPTVLANLCNFLGLDYDPAMVQVSDRGSSHASESGRRGFDASRLDSWREKLTPTEIWLAERFFQSHLTQPRTGARPQIGDLAKLALTFPRDAIFSLYYSVKSYGSILDAFRRRFL